VLVWFRITLTTFRARITTIHLYLSKLYINIIGSTFFRRRCILIACLYRVLPRLSFFFTFPYLSPPILIFSVENRPAQFPGRMSYKTIKHGFLCLFCVVVHIFRSENACFCCVRFGVFVHSQPRDHNSIDPVVRRSSNTWWIDVASVKRYSNAIKAKQSALNARKPLVGGREPHLCSWSFGLELQPFKPRACRDSPPFAE